MLTTLHFSASIGQPVFDGGNGLVYLSEFPAHAGAPSNLTVIGGSSILGQIAFNNTTETGAADPATGTYYAPIPGDDSVALVNGSRLVATIPVAANPGGAVYDPADGFVYIVASESNSAGNISVLNGSTVVTTLTVSGAPEAGVADPVNGDVYFPLSGSYSASGGTTEVTIVRGTAVLANVAVNQGADAVAIDPVTGLAYVVSSGIYDDSGTVAVFNGTRIVANLTVGVEPVAATYDPADGEVYVACAFSHNLTEIRGTTKVATTFLGVRTDPIAVLADPLDGDLLVSDSYGSDQVTVVNGTSIYENLSVGPDAQAGAMDPWSGYAYLPFGQFNVSVIDGGASALRVNAFNATPSDPPVNTSVTFQVAAAGGVPPYTYLYSGLPPGCAGANASTLVCTPTVSGSYVVRVNLSDVAGNRTSASLPITVRALVISSFSAVPAALVVNSSTRVSVTTVGGVGPLSYLYAGLPPGCVPANRSSLTCRPQRAGEYTLGVAVNDSAGHGARAITNLNVSFVTLANLSASPSVVEIGAGTNASTTLSASPQPALAGLSFVYTGLPAGCRSANASSISCTPNGTGIPPSNAAEFSVRVFVNDSLGDSVSGTIALEVVPALAGTLGPAQNSTDVGVPLAFGGTVDGGKGPYAYAWQFGDGTSASTADPTHAYGAPGPYTARAWINDSLGGSYSRAWNLTVAPALSVVLTVSNATPVLGQTLLITANVSGGSGPFSYVYEALPPGCVSVDQPTIGCLPTQAGFYNFSVGVGDANNGSVTGTAGIQVIFDFTVVSPSTVVVGQPLIITVRTGLSYGTLTYAYVGLPPGCAPVNAPQLRCAPTAIGSYAVTISVHDQLGEHAEHTVRVAVVSPPASLSPAVAGALLAGAAALGLAAAVAVRTLGRRRELPP